MLPVEAVKYSANTIDDVSRQYEHCIGKMWDRNKCVAKHFSLIRREKTRGATDGTHVRLEAIPFEKGDFVACRFTNGSCEFIMVDNERPLDVGSLSRGTKTFQVRKPIVPEGFLEVIVRENSEEVTLTTQEVGTLKALVNVDHIEQERWGPPLVDADWYASCQALYNGIEGEDWRERYEAYK